MEKTGRELMAHAASNSGVVSRSEALALGVSSSSLHRWVDEGRLVKVGTGMYLLPGVLTSEHSLLKAATAALGAVISHESAARIHRLDGLDPKRVTVTVPVRRSNRFVGVIVHQSTDLGESETNDIDGLTVTDVPRTINDLAAVLPKRPLAMVLDQAVRMKLTTYEEVAGRLEATARRGKPGVVKLRDLLAVRLGGSLVSDSTLETMTLELIDSAGLPLPSTQYRPPWLRRVNGRVDFAYIDEEIIVECDSMRWHGTPESFQLDRQRDNLAQLAGWIVLRFTWEDITKRPSYVVRSIRHALIRRSNSQIREPQH
ncbi:MAG TPA: type IV toxin-antitoxin system AbiEi family antitoxin domain-containing protein [Acidimicrobiia bacterium]